jgi:hypothetical protein
MVTFFLLARVSIGRNDGEGGESHSDLISDNMYM